MLSGLAVGLEAIQAQGVEVRRVLLIGGAAANEGVARIAAQVFDAEIVVPAAGEYVALGAARQAAGVLAGGPVEWTVATTRAVAPDHHPEIRERYDVVAGLRATE